MVGGFLHAALRMVGWSHVNNVLAVTGGRGGKGHVTQSF